MRKLLVLVAALGAGAVAIPGTASRVWPEPRPGVTKDRPWPAYGGDAQLTNSVGATAMTPATVSRLRLHWQRTLRVVG